MWCAHAFAKPKNHVTPICLVVDVLSLLGPLSQEGTWGGVVSFVWPRLVTRVSMLHITTRRTRVLFWVSASAENAASSAGWLFNPLCCRAYRYSVARTACRLPNAPSLGEWDDKQSAVFAEESCTVLTICSEEIRKTRNERGDCSLQHSSRSIGPLTITLISPQVNMISCVLYVTQNWSQWDVAHLFLKDVNRYPANYELKEYGSENTVHWSFTGLWVSSAAIQCQRGSSDSCSGVWC